MIRIASIGIILSILFYLLKKISADSIAKILNVAGLYSLSLNKFYVDEIYSALIYKPFMWWSKIASKIDWDLYDQRFIDGWGWITLKLSNKSGDIDYNWLDQKVVDGFGKATDYFGKKLKSTQSGIIQNYVLGGMIGIVLIIFLIQKL